MVNLINSLNPYLYHIARVTELNKPDPVKGYDRRITVFHELEWITNGKGTMISNNEVIYVNEGNLLYRPPGVRMHAFGDYQCYLIVFDPFIHTKDSIAKVPGEGGNRFIGNFIKKEEVVLEKPLPIPSMMHLHSELEYKTLFLELTKAFSSHNQDRDFLTKIKLLELLKKVFNDSEKQKTSEMNHLMFKRHSKKLEMVMKEIDHNPKKNIVLENVANEIGLSKYHFSRLFKTYTGMNISVYHRNARLNLAKHLLINTDDTIKSIAIQTGFETTTYFYKVFRKHMHMTPISYREHYLI